MSNGSPVSVGTIGHIDHDVPICGGLIANCDFDNSSWVSGRDIPFFSDKLIILAGSEFTSLRGALDKANAELVAFGKSIQVVDVSSEIGVVNGFRISSISLDEYMLPAFNAESPQAKNFNDLQDMLGKQRKQHQRRGGKR